MARIGRAAIGRAAGGRPGLAGFAARGRRRRYVSPLTLRILAINAIAPALMVFGLLYLDQYRAGLVEQKVRALRVEATLIAGAIGETAFSGPPEIPGLETEMSRQIVRRLVATTGNRARLYDLDGSLIADSRSFIVSGSEVVSQDLLTPAPSETLVERASDAFYAALAAFLSGPDPLEVYQEQASSMAEFPEVVEAMQGETVERIRRNESGARVINVAVPIQALRKVRGSLLLTTVAQDVEERVRTERVTILELLLSVLGVTVLLSLFLAGTIGRPVRRLAVAAMRARAAQGKRVEIPDFAHRRDEIGDLSTALRGMTDALYARIEAIESFAADVAHELKNPLTSLRSALETIARSDDEEQRRRLIRICVRDIARLNRLISDISDASRLDAELARAEAEPVDLPAMCGALAEIHNETAGENAPRVELDIGPGDMTVMGLEGRLGQVARNLVDNALSFSPAGAPIYLRLRRDGARVVLEVEDRGPGIPAENLEKIFDRFYSDRPAGERFGTHSGLGLAISRQIVEAHGGSMAAGNAAGPDGEHLGALFRVTLPAR
jgi:two-component system sensor histidine kinase ChvG